jgi:hypothetical protein
MAQTDLPRVAVVTGSESGIGRATAVALAESGSDVGITWYQDEGKAQATAEEVRGTGRRAEVRHLDLTRLPGAADVVDELADALGGIDVLVNCAGTGATELLLDTDYETWRTVLATDLEGRSCACSGPPGGWSPPAAAAGSSTSPASTSTSRGSAAVPTAPPRAASGCSPGWPRWSWPSTASP